MNYQGSPSHYRTDKCLEKLGNGIQEIFPRIQDDLLLRERERAERTSSWLENATFIQRLYNILPACSCRPADPPSYALGLHDLGRSSQHQELPISAMADIAWVSVQTSFTFNGYSAAGMSTPFLRFIFQEAHCCY